MNSKICTSIEQSKKLAKILPLESADMGYLWNGISFGECPVSKQTIFERVENIPCWSLAALLEIISYPTLSQEYDGKWSCREYQEGEEVEGYDNPVDACYEMIIKLHEQKLI